MVVALIVILAALLFASLARAKARAQSISCRAQLRQIGVALQLYLTDHRHYPPMWGQDMGTFQIWADRLYPYLPVNWTNRAWQCPAYIASQGIIKLVKPPREVAVHMSYAYNAYGIAFIIGSPQLGLGIRRAGSLVTEPEVSAPSEMYAVADSRTYRDMFYGGEGIVPGLSGGIAMSPYYAQSEETAPLHGQGYNILFGDGHVLMVRRSDYLFPPRTAQHWNRDNLPHPEAWAPRTDWAVRN